MHLRCFAHLFGECVRHVTCYKSSMNKLMKLLVAAHVAECEEHGAEFYNVGAVTDENGIGSKTSKGWFHSDIDPKTKKVTHTWDSNVRSRSGITY